MRGMLSGANTYLRRSAAAAVPLPQPSLSSVIVYCVKVVRPTPLDVGLDVLDCLEPHNVPGLAVR